MTCPRQPATIALNVRVAPGDDARLREIAASVGAMAKRVKPPAGGSVGEMLRRIASGELLVVPAEPAGRYLDLDEAQAAAEAAAQREEDTGRREAGDSGRPLGWPQSLTQI